MRQLRIVALTFLVAGSIILAPREARAADWTIQDNAVSNRPHQLDVVGFIWPFTRITWFGGAVWYGIPVLPKGFVSPWNDSLVVEFGAISNMVFDTKLDRNYFVIVPSGGVRWNVYLTRDWTVFATAKLGWWWVTGGNALSTYAVSGSVGAYWHMSRDLWVRLEVGNFGVAQAGISIPF